MIKKRESPRIWATSKCDSDKIVPHPGRTYPSVRRARSDPGAAGARRHGRRRRPDRGAGPAQPAPGSLRTTRASSYGQPIEYIAYEGSCHGRAARAVHGACRCHSETAEQRRRSDPGLGCRGGGARRGGRVSRMPTLFGGDTKSVHGDSDSCRGGGGAARAAAARTP